MPDAWPVLVRQAAGMGTGWASAVVSMSGAVVAVGTLIVSVIDRRAVLRNTKSSVHRDTWWQRWSWVADRATSNDERERDAAALMVGALTSRPWATPDDIWMLSALERFELRSDETEDVDDLEAQ